jgi:hypothetical protein
MDGGKLVGATSFSLFLCFLNIKSINWEKIARLQARSICLQILTLNRLIMLKSQKYNTCVLIGAFCVNSSINKIMENKSW